VQQNKIITTVNKNFRHKIVLKDDINKIDYEVANFSSWASIVGNGRLLVIKGNYDIYCKRLYGEEKIYNKTNKDFTEIIYIDDMNLDFNHIKVKTNLSVMPKLFNYIKGYSLVIGEISCELYEGNQTQEKANKIVSKKQSDQIINKKGSFTSLPDIKENNKGILNDNDKKENDTNNDKKESGNEASKSGINSFENNIKIARPNLKIVSILDEFSYECFKYECKLIQLEPYNWKLTIEKTKPDLLFVESAWKGNNSLWRYNIGNTKKRTSETLVELISFCKQLNIPTVFWNKEDPVHFEHFIETAKLFEYIFTTDADSISRYKYVVGHNRIYLLPFAAQPRMHNPIDKDRKKLGKVAFAGTWYNKKYLNRQKDMEMLLKQAIKSGLDIYDRCYNDDKYNSYRFPDIYQPYIRGNLPYEKMVQTYKKYDVFLNVNSVQGSPTMFSRRVFELLACGTNIVSGYSLGVERMFDRIVKLCRTKQDTRKNIEVLLDSQELRDRLSILGQREVFNKHTYSHRIDTILENVGLSKEKIKKPGVSIIVHTNSLQSIADIFGNYERQSYEKKELIVVTNIPNINLDEWKERGKQYKNVKIFKLAEHKLPGECINFAVEQSNFGFIAKFADNAYYAEEYLKDLMNAFKYTYAGVVGKCTSYIYYESSKILAIRFPNMENRYVKHLTNSTMVIKRDVFNRVRFSDVLSIGQEMQFLKDCISKGIKIYASDRFNHIFIEKNNYANNSKIDEQEYIKNCDIVIHTDDYITHVTI